MDRSWLARGQIKTHNRKSQTIILRNWAFSTRSHMRDSLSPSQVRAPGKGATHRGARVEGRRRVQEQYDTQEFATTSPAQLPLQGGPRPNSPQTATMQFWRCQESLVDEKLPSVGNPILYFGLRHNLKDGRSSLGYVLPLLFLKGAFFNSFEQHTTALTQKRRNQFAPELIRDR